MKAFLITGLCVTLLIPASSLWGYEVKEIAGGGTVQGTVTLSGPVPDPKAYNLVIFPDPEYCGRISNGNGWRLLRDFLVNEQGQVLNVVVLLEGVKEGKPFSLSVPRVEARDCRFSPFTTVVRSGHGIEVVNMDPVMHDIQAYETSAAMGTRVLFNSPLPFNHRHQRGDLHATHDHRPGESLVRQFQLSKKRRTFVMQCGFHAYMESWAIAVDNPYYVLTDENGQFSIEEVPPGTYDLRAWHPGVKQVMKKPVTIEPGANLTIDFQLPSPGRRKTALTVRTPPRFTPAALGREFTIEPLLERQ
ncbi:MAG: carboxypeptidase-like regulatory domain-containing protein [Nitrospira sp.]|nr:carboxypeptidase-like regulatory domain-containing protein [Nitrospira sp.]MDE0487549.1 carboxypeptidase-like regulatory domain-containing protein [Nitrospira sp.]